MRASIPGLTELCLQESPVHRSCKSGDIVGQEGGGYRQALPVWRTNSSPRVQLMKHSMLIFSWMQRGAPSNWTSPDFCLPISPVYHCQVQNLQKTTLHLLMMEEYKRRATCYFRICALPAALSHRNLSPGLVPQSSEPLSLFPMNLKRRDLSWRDSFSLASTSWLLLEFTSFSKLANDLKVQCTFLLCCNI